MFNFEGTTHVIENPRGHAEGYNYSLVGSVPVSMMDLKPATSDDVMAGRAIKSPNGELFAPKTRRWETVPEILHAATLNAVQMCNSPECACRKLF